MSAAGRGAVLGALQFCLRAPVKRVGEMDARLSVICAVGWSRFRNRTCLDSCAVLFVVGFAATFADGPPTNH